MSWDAVNSSRRAAAGKEEDAINSSGNNLRIETGRVAPSEKSEITV